MITRGMNRTQLTSIAAIAMVIDHIGVFLLPSTSPWWIFCRTLGRLTCPLMCFFLAEGFVHTRSRKSYAIRLLLFALVSQPVYFFLNRDLSATVTFNMLFTLLLSFLILWSYKEIASIGLKTISVCALFVLSLLCDWGLFAPLTVFVFYLFREERKRRLFAFAAGTFFFVIAGIAENQLRQVPWYASLWQCGLFLAVPFLLHYRGENGSKHPFHKWFFYVFYPLHLLILIFIK